MFEHLFDAELVYRSGIEPLARDGEGELIGSGDGTVVGPAIAGMLLWTLFERPGKLVCTMNPVAMIEIADGTRVRSRRVVSGDDRRRRAGPGLSPRRCGSRARTTAIAGSTKRSACGKASSTRRSIAPTTRPSLVKNGISGNQR